MATLPPTAGVPRQQQESPPGTPEPSKSSKHGGGGCDKHHASSGSPRKQNEKQGFTTDGEQRHAHEDGAGAGGCGGAADTAREPPAVEERSCLLPRPSPPTPPQPMCSTQPTPNGAPKTSSSFRPPRSSGIVARSFSGNFSDMQERAASLGDRYKGSSIFRHQEQQQRGGSNKYHGNTVMRSGDRYGERPGSRRSSDGRVAAGGRAGEGFGDRSYSPRKYSAASRGAIGADGSATGWPDTEDGHGNPASGGRRREKGIVAGKDAKLGAEAEGFVEEEEGRGGERQQGNGRVAQIAESESLLNHAIPYHTVPYILCRMDLQLLEFVGRGIREVVTGLM